MVPSSLIQYLSRSLRVLTSSSSWSMIMMVRSSMECSGGWSVRLLGSVSWVWYQICDQWSVRAVPSLSYQHTAIHSSYIRSDRLHTLSYRCRRQMQVPDRICRWPCFGKCQFPWWNHRSYSLFFHIACFLCILWRRQKIKLLMPRVRVRERINPQENLRDTYKLRFFWARQFVILLFQSTNQSCWTPFNVSTQFEPHAVQILAHVQSQTSGTQLLKVHHLEYLAHFPITL